MTDSEVALRRPIALTMGEPAGIAPEITLKAWAALDRDETAPIRFFTLADPEYLRDQARILGLSVPIMEIETPDAAGAAFSDGLPVLPLALKVFPAPGHPVGENSRAVLASIEQAVSLTRNGRASATVTNPIQKSVLYEAGFGHPGHTEYLARLCGTAQAPVMMLVCSELRVVPVTGHCALRDAIDTLSTELIVDRASITCEALRQDFGIERPKLAVAGLNPHAGEGGSMGREEMDIIAPAVAELDRLGIDAWGPVPPDTLFHATARSTYDACICMYHDQALIPLKTIDFEHGVNVTLGLPIIRTSPDHGTALDIAGTGRASPASLVAALSMASALAAQRQHGLQPPHWSRA